MTMTDKPTQSTLMRLATAVSPRIRILGIRLAKSLIRSDCPKGMPPAQADYSFDAETTVDAESRKITVCARFILTAKPLDASQTASPLLHIDAEFLLDYEAKSLDGLSEENFDAFGKINGIYNAWPYWREYVQSTTVRLCLPPLTLPALTGEAIEAIYSKNSEVDATQGSANE